MATRVKELVNEYEKWHIREVGLGAVDWIKDQSVFDSEDDEEEVAEEGGKCDWIGNGNRGNV